MDDGYRGGRCRSVPRGAYRKEGEQTVQAQAYMNGDSPLCDDPYFRALQRLSKAVVTSASRGLPYTSLWRRHSRPSHCSLVARALQLRSQPTLLPFSSCILHAPAAPVHQRDGLQRGPRVTCLTWTSTARLPPSVDMPASPSLQAALPLLPLPLKVLGPPLSPIPSLQPPPLCPPPSHRPPRCYRPSGPTMRRARSSGCASAS